MTDNWVEITKTTTPISDLVKELDALMKVSKYPLFQNDKDQELIEKTIKTLLEKIKSEMESVNWQWKHNKK